MEGTQSGSAATGCGVVGTDDTTLVDVVEASSFVAAGERLRVHFTSSYNTACLAMPDSHTKFQDVEKLEQVERGPSSQIKKAEKLELEAWPVFGIFDICRKKKKREV